MEVIINKTMLDAQTNPGLQSYVSGSGIAVQDVTIYTGSYSVVCIRIYNM